MSALTARTFRAFRYKNYQLFFGGMLVSRIGTWMQFTAVLWLVYILTHSPLMLGLVVFAEQFPAFIFSPLGGAIADRYNRYHIILITQVVSALQAVMLTVFYFTGYHQIWLILMLSVILGVANAFDIPARQPMVHDIMDDPDDLPNAIALNSTLNNLARLIGPAISGFILEKYGAGTCFGLNAVSFIAVIISLTAMTLPAWKPKKNKKKIGTDLTEGFAYVKNTREIGVTLLYLTLLCLLVMSYNTLLPVYAKEIFMGDARTFGYLNAAIGLGAVSSAMYIASRKPGTDLKKLLFINTLLLGISLILFSHLNMFSLALVIAVLCGFGTMSVMPICNTLVQVASSNQMRGRVISYFAMAAFGTIPIGSLVIGWVSKTAGAQNSILAQGVIALLLAFIFSGFLLNRRNRKKEITEDDTPVELANHSS